ncbi:MAG: sensor histidine kinase, partial [Thermodesulfobacteriota bacterium]
NEHRQILAVNHAYLELLGIDDAEAILGLRPGEAVHCIYAHDAPGGCGTGRYCSTCGAAVAIVSGLGLQQPVERFCALTIDRGPDGKKDVFLSVRSVPFHAEGRPFLLLFLKDITRQNQWAALEKVFFHDINNLIHSMVLSSELLMLDCGRGGEALKVHNLSVHLAGEVAIQRSLVEDDAHVYNVLKQEIPVQPFLERLADAARTHPAASRKTFTVEGRYPGLSAFTDSSLLFRVLHNMTVNALEATAENEEARLHVETGNDDITFCVWNRQPIPADIARRVFQRNFSTKGGIGRGLGTFSMKFFGEKMLGGKVSFESSPELGTVFRFRINR